MLPCAVTAEGEVYITYDAPTGPLVGGMAHQNDGTLCVIDATTSLFANGFMVNDIGQVCISPGGTIFDFKDGLPRDINGKLVIESTEISNPILVGLQNWYKQGDFTVVNGLVTNWNDSSAAGLNRDLVQAVPASQPQALLWDGENYLKFFNLDTQANRVVTPKASAPPSGGNIGIAVRVSLDDWSPSPANSNNLFSSGTGGTTTAWRFLVAPSGALSFGYTTAGTIFIEATSSAVTGIPDGQFRWVGVFWDRTTGLCYFYTAPDSVNPPIGAGWTQLGTPQSLADATIYAGQADYALGRYTNGFQLVGRLYRAMLWTGESPDNTPTGCTTPQLDCNVTATPLGALTITDGVNQAAVWTPNTTASQSTYIVDGSQVSFVGNVSLQALYTQAQPVTICALVRRPAWVSNTTVFDGGALNSAALKNFNLSPQLAIQSGAAASPTVNGTLGPFLPVAAIFNGASSTLRVGDTSIAAGTGTDTTAGLTLGASGANTLFSECQFKELAVWNRVLSQVEIDQVFTYFAGLTTYGIVTPFDVDPDAPFVGGIRVGLGGVYTVLGPVTPPGSGFALGFDAGFGG